MTKKTRDKKLKELFNKARIAAKNVDIFTTMRIFAKIRKIERIRTG